MMTANEIRYYVGGKNKARFLRYKDGKVSVILYPEDKQKIIKDFEIEKIKKIFFFIQKI